LKLLNRFVQVNTLEQFVKLTREIKEMQHFLSKYAFTKDQHLGFEAAA
jgi:hypothetical protein